MSMQNTTPGKRPAQTGMKPSGSIKRDINLMPANETSEKLARNGTIALAVFVGLLIAAYFAIVMPSITLKALQDKAANAQNQAKQLESAETQFNDKTAQLKVLRQVVAFLENADSAYREPQDINAELERACPQGIMLTGFTMNATGMTIDGFADSDTTVAQFIVNLKTAFPQFESATLAFTKQATDTENKQWIRQFELTVPEPAPLPTATATTEGGAAK
jgi:Tfp pilus assembly protein PilN